MKEKEIRPLKLFERFLHLSSLDVKKFFYKSTTKVNCVACGRKGQFSFKKKNFSYYECPNCRTLFVNPRPEEKAFLNYYTNSSSIKFLADNLYKKTREIRDKIKESIERRCNNLSMGMSNDFEIAIAEGATHIRIGTALFGERP